METIKAFLEADSKRTQGEWIAGIHPANHKMNIIKPIMFGDRVGKLPEHEGSHAFFRNQDDANFIALASTLAPAIRTMLADIEMARETLENIWHSEFSNSETCLEGGWIKQALSALDKYKGGV